MADRRGPSQARRSLAGPSTQRPQRWCLAHSAEQTRRVEESAAIDPGLAAVVLAGLNPTYRAALVLRHVDGLSVAAVADHLDRSVEATEQVLSRARAAFRDQVSGINR